MKIKTGILALTASSILAMTPALAQQSGGGSSEQTIIQEEPSGTGAPLHVSPATVRQVQQALNNEGYDAGPVDGNWGEQTQTALESYQQAQGLEPTGNINERTLKALKVQPEQQTAQATQQEQSGGGGQSGSSGQSGGGSQSGSSGQSGGSSQG